MRDLYWQSDAWLEYVDLQKDKALCKKINSLIKDILRNGYQAEYGKVELLKGNFSGYASVRIDKKNRLIFTADAGRITVIRCGGHYGDH
ncbi:MAG: Txe/YoeB family addiction module toxin [Lachnospiraceae bacterium]|nr:Txe/YoeB family addiction module toxin [Lachnospiraceae bacterium]